LGMTRMWPTCSAPRSPCAFFDSSLIFFIIALPLGSSFAPGLIGWVLFDVAMTISLLGGILGRCCSGTTRRSEFKVRPAKVTHRSLVIVADDGQQSCGTMSPQPTSPADQALYSCSGDVGPPEQQPRSVLAFPLSSCLIGISSPQQGELPALFGRRHSLAFRSETYFFCPLLRAAGFANARSSILLSLLYS
jgi:hypothetical protein